MCAVSFWGLQPKPRRLCVFLQSNDAVVPDTHTTVGYDEPTSDGPFPSVSLALYQFVLISCPLLHTPVSYFLC